MAYTTPPSADSVFPSEERDRIRFTAVAYSLVTEDERSDKIIETHFQKVADDEDLSTLGLPDTSRNPIISICNHVSTPGHYGVQPTVAGMDAERIKALLDPLWPMKQRVEFLAFALGSCLVQTDWSTALNRLVFRIVPPHEVWGVAHPDDPREMVTARKLRIRTVLTGNTPRDVYVWDEYDVSDPSMPRFRLVEAKSDGALGEDMTETFLGHGPMVGEEYPYRDDNGAFIPFDIHRSKDHGDLFAWKSRKGTYRGVLNAMFIATCSMRAVYGSTGRTHIVSNVDASGIVKGKTPGSKATGSMKMRPGDVLFTRHEMGTTPWAYSFDAGDHLNQLGAFNREYASDLAVDSGITPTDQAKAGANPQSGIAIHLTNEMKRYLQRQQLPLCLACDSSTLRKSVALFNRQSGKPSISSADVHISYTEIAKSPDEQRAEREGYQWRIDNGLMSQVDLMLATNPGMDRTTAVGELTRIAAEEDLLRTIAAAHAEVRRPPPPEPTTPAAPVPPTERTTP